jgi:ABC-type dipeptide/oligopeptide/nickel transport system permease component
VLCLPDIVIMIAVIPGISVGAHSGFDLKEVCDGVASEFGLLVCAVPVIWSIRTVAIYTLVDRSFF